MPADVATPAPVATTDGRRSGAPGAVVVGLALRGAARSGAMWGLVFGIAVASSALSYTSLYRTPTQRAALATAYGANNATRALFGPAPALQTVAGFTAFKVSMTLMLLGAVWGILTGTRLLRGEEDDGRWELLLAGRTTARGATAQTAVGLAGGVAALWAVTAVLTAATGRSASVGIGVGPALLFALATVATAAMFAGVATVTSQLAADRRRAAAYAAVVLGVAYAVRMVGDAGVGLHALVWASPLGWVEQLAPLTGARPLALLPIVGSTLVLALVAVHLAGRRDLGAGVLVDRTAPRSHLGLLGGPVGLGVRLVRPVALGWWVAVAVAGLLYGLVARSAASTVSGSSVHQVLERLGATGSGAATVLGLGFLMLAVLLAFAAAGQVTAARDEESSGRVENLLTRPLSPAAWLGGRVLLAVGVLVVGGPVGGLAAWLGAASQGAGVPLGALLAAGVNLVPPAAVVLGIGTLALGLRPRSAAVVVYGYVTWSLLVVVVGGIGSSSRWLLDTSVFHQMSASPAVPVDRVSAGVMVAVAATCVAGGLAAFARRDLAGA